FFHELNNFFVLVNSHYTKCTCFLNRHWHTSYGATCTFFDVVDQHTRVVLLVYMIPGEDYHVLSFVTTNNIQVLRNRICRSAIPVFAFHSLLSRQQIDELIHLFIEE